MKKEIMGKERDEYLQSELKTSTMTSATPSSSSSLDLEAEFSSMYNSIFPPPRSTHSSSDITGYRRHRIATEHRLQQARLILEHQQLCDHYDLCFARLQAINRELDTLRQENADLRLANAGLLKLLTNNFHRLTEEISSGFGPNNGQIEPNRFDKANILKRDSFPKSISVRSRGYIKPKQIDTNSGTSHQRADHQSVNVPTGGKKKEEEEEAAAAARAIELEVYNQGMWKTELCSKWQETGTCPYGEYCQFAHGITELRPVIRHPKYKTEACRMVLSGNTCPYGHRCHFRHSLTEQESLQVPR